LPVASPEDGKRRLTYVIHSGTGVLPGAANDGEQNA